LRRSGGKTVNTGETAEGALKRVSSFRTFTSGSKSLDGLLRGGYREGTITVLFGRSNSGKTQLAMQAAMICAQTGSSVLFVDTEGSFRPERVEEMAKSRGWDADGILQKIVYVRCDSASEQMEAVRQMPFRRATASCRMVVIDTLTRNFSVEMPGRANLSSRQAALNVHLSEMARDAFRNERAYLLTNRVTFGLAGDVGIGGRTVEQLVHASVLLERDDGRVRATLGGTEGSVLAEMGKPGVD
jgi:DNA repair protein RadA